MVVEARRLPAQTLAGMGAVVARASRAFAGAVGRGSTAAVQASPAQSDCAGCTGIRARRLARHGSVAAEEWAVGGFVTPAHQAAGSCAVVWAGAGWMRLGYLRRRDAAGAAEEGRTAAAAAAVVAVAEGVAGSRAGEDRRGQAQDIQVATCRGEVRAMRSRRGTLRWAPRQTILGEGDALAAGGGTGSKD